MTVRAIPRVSVGQNGVGAFILQCKRIDMHYCNQAGSSKGMNIFIRTHLRQFTAENPQVEIALSPRPRKHPVLVGHYINGKSKAICVKNMEPGQVLQKAVQLRNDSGTKVKRFTKPVQSINESVRGIWSPYHGRGMVV